MLYLLDANVLIDANRDYYSFDIVPEFWDWLIYIGINDSVKIPFEIYEEIKAGDDPLADWTKEPSTRKALLLAEDVQADLLRKVTNEGYAPDLTDIEIESIGRDPFLIAYGLAEPDQRCIVTTESSKPSRTRAKRHVPDICRQFSIKTCNTFQFVHELNFKTNWKRK